MSVTVFPRFRYCSQSPRLESRTCPAIVKWDGGGSNLLWSNPLNWDNDAVPTADDDVFLDAAGNVTITLNMVPQTIKSFQLSDGLSISTGGLKVLNSVNLGPGTSVIVTNNTVFFEGLGDSTISGANLSAVAGGRITLLGATKLAAGTASGTIKANGIDSRVELPGLTTATGPGSSLIHTLLAELGGTIELPNLASVTAGNVTVKAINGNSAINAPNWVSFSLSGTTETGILSATNNAAINAPALVDLARVKVTISDTSVLPTSQIKTFKSSAVTVSSGAVVSFPNVTAYDAAGIGQTLEATGAASKLSFPNLTSLKGFTTATPTRFLALSGGRVELPQLAESVAGAVEFRATGGGSFLDLPVLKSLAPVNLDASQLTATVTGTVNVPVLDNIQRTTVVIADTAKIQTAQVTTLTSATVKAQAGAKVSFPGVTSYITSDLTTFLQADGSQSQLSFPNLTVLKGGKSNIYAQVQALNGGRVDLPVLPGVDNGFVELKADGTNSVVSAPVLANFNPVSEFGKLTASEGGTVSVPQLTKINRVTVTVTDTATVPTAQITNLNSSTVTVTTGAKVSFPGVTAYETAIAATLNSKGSGSVLEFPNLTSLKGGTFSTTLSVEAFTGGRTAMPALMKIDNGNVVLRADGAAAKIDLPALELFAPTTETGQIFGLRAGMIHVPVLSQLGRITLNLADTAQMQTAQLTNILTSSVVLTDGAVHDFPGVTEYDPGTFGTNLVAEDKGSILRFPNLVSFKGGGSVNSVNVDARAGGRVEMNVLPQIDTGRVVIRATGPGSAVQMLKLAAIPYVSNTGSIVVDTDAQFDAPILATVNRVTLTLSDQAKMATAQITDLNASSVVLANGAVFSFPGVTAYDAGPDSANWQADGALTTLTFPNLVAMKGSGSIFRTTVNALNGGKVDLPVLPEITAGNLDFKADGGGSFVGLAKFATFAYLSETGNLFATNDGKIDAPVLTKLNRIVLTVADTGQFATAQITDFNSSGAAIKAAAVVTFPGVTAYETNQTTTLNATGTGSRLIFPNLTSFKGPGSISNTTVSANDGGRVEFPVLASIEAGNVNIKADGGDSTIDLPVMKLFAPTAEVGTMTVVNGGKVNVPVLEKASRVTFNIGDVGQLQTAQMTDLNGSSVVASNGAQVSFPGITALESAAVSPTLQATGSGTQLIFPNLTSLKGAQTGNTLRVQTLAGGRLEMPGVTALDNGIYELKSDGAGSFLKVPNLASYTPVNGSGTLFVTNNGKVQTAANLEMKQVTFTFDPTNQMVVTNLNLDAGSVMNGFGKLTANVTNAGTIFPVTSALTGVLTIAGNYTQVAAGKVQLEINGPIFGNNYDRVRVTGSVTVAGNLSTVLSTLYAPSIGDSFLLIDNQGAGPVVGTFSGLPEGATVTLNKQDFKLSYVGGTGNDVVLTRGSPNPDAPPTVSQIVINGGEDQRSMVTKIVVEFSQVVTLPANPAEAFVLSQQPGGAVVGLTADVTTVGTTSVKLSFTGALSDAGSLVDGKYTLTVLSAKVSNANGALDGDNDGTAGGDATATLFRFFGDSNGDGTVNFTDFLAFRSTFGLKAGDAGFNAAFDSNGDGAVNFTDFLAFRTRFGTSVP